MAPGDWTMAVIIPVFKKDSRLDCANYSGESPLSKVFGWILNERVKVMTDVKVMDEQGGFKAGSGRVLVKCSSSQSQLRHWTTHLLLQSNSTTKHIFNRLSKSGCNQLLT